MKAFSTLAIMEASVSPHVSHDMLNDGIVEARAYQLEAVDEALNSSMLLVMPTAAGKTAAGKTQESHRAANRNPKESNRQANGKPTES